MSVNLGVRLASGGSLRVCVNCTEPFVQFHRLGVQTHCPRCNDERQRRSTVVQARECLWEMCGVRIVALPGNWKEFRPSEKDEPAFRISLKGEVFGAAWDGRIEIHAPQAFTGGDVVVVRHMKVAHKTKVVTSSRPTMEHGTIEVQREVGLRSEEAGAEEVVLEREYISLEPAFVAPKACLVWTSVHSKYTFKGFGRQYSASISGTPLHSWRVSGGVRSGRAYSVGVLAVVDTEHPLVARGKGDVQFERVYPAEADPLFIPTWDGSPDPPTYRIVSDLEESAQAETPEEDEYDRLARLAEEASQHAPRFTIGEAFRALESADDQDEE